MLGIESSEDEGDQVEVVVEAMQEERMTEKEEEEEETLLALGMQMWNHWLVIALNSAPTWIFQLKFVPCLVP